MKLCSALLALALLIPAADSEAVDNSSLRGDNKKSSSHHRVLAKGPNNVPSIVQGNLGNVGVTVSQANSVALQNAAANSMKTIASDKFGLSKTFQAKGKPYFSKGDTKGKAHVRVVNVIQGEEVEGASVVLHIEVDGTISAINGEIVTGDIDMNGPKLPAFDALLIAVEEAKLSGGEFDREPTLAVVRTSDGEACHAWKATYFYETTDELGFLKPNRDEIYAQVSDGSLCALFPRIYGARQLNTQNCGTTTSCTTVTTSPNTISTGDAAIDAAHNYAIDTYNYYSEKHGRDSIDDNGMLLKSRVHYNKNYNNAFWDGTQMTYGDGDGTTFIPFSMSADVVAHELTHGVTERTSNLVYSYESGALNEAFSDIFGAMVDAYTGATGMDIWKVGETIYTPGTSGDALRYMYDPVLGNDYDWYPTRYMGTQDNGGVHWNSGIANLAFYLLSVGGSHPRGKSTVVVPGIGMEAAANIFYAANVGCLTSSSNFESARFCTSVVHGGANQAAVNSAWEAVGVVPKVTIEIQSGVSKTGLSGGGGDVQQFRLSAVPANYIVSCTTAGPNGDADLYLRFGAEAVVSTSTSSPNACSSYSSISNEACTTGTTSSATDLYAAVHAYTTYSSLTLTCTASIPSNPPPPTCTANGFSCTSTSQCCPGTSCKGRPKVCK